MDWADEKAREILQKYWLDRVGAPLPEAIAAALRSARAEGYKEGAIQMRERASKLVGNEEGVDFGISVLSIEAPTKRRPQP